MPSGAIGDCGQDPEPAGDLLRGHAVDALAVEEHRARRVGLSSRARARSNVDLPHALAPTMHVILPGRDLDATGRVTTSIWS